jgi:hypothetical protein
MALFSGALCFQGWTLMRGGKLARVAGIVSASALVIGNIAVALVVALPWMSAGDGTELPRALLPALSLLLTTGSAFAVAAAILIRDAHARRKSLRREG